MGKLQKHLERNIIFRKGSMQKFIYMLCLILISSCGPNKINSTHKDEGSHIVPEEKSLIEEALFFCSQLDFSGMVVPVGLTARELNLFALALNISSSFEGHEGWSNITNNFDGQGLSLGLLNQTLGTESLQPLLLEMLQAHRQKMSSIFSTTNFNSIEQMLLQWKGTVGIQKNTELFARDESSISRLDSLENKNQTFSVAGENSVRWAKSTLYTDAQGLRFKSDWKSQLQSLASASEYRSLQFEAARFLHEKAQGYYERFRMEEARSYLFMFDIVVQNGGFYTKNLQDFENFMTQNPRATETQKLQAILNSRLVQVREEYREDVRLRKQSLIDGQGRVHGVYRDYGNEYCLEYHSL